MTKAETQGTFRKLGQNGDIEPFGPSELQKSPKYQICFSRLSVSRCGIMIAVAIADSIIAVDAQPFSEIGQLSVSNL